jgi:hypothetical protein
MASAIDGAAIRKVLLEVIGEYNTADSSFQSRSVLNEAARRLGIHYDMPAQQALLTMWHDLYRSGHLSWGFNIDNPEPPFCHMTDRGRAFLQHLSRDPMNPDGYLAHLSQTASLSPISMSYLEEALRTYVASCFKATAVLVGCASEAMCLELRDTLVKKISSLTHKVPSGLTDWKIKKVLDALKADLDTHLSQMPSKLKESYQSYWPAFIQQIRATRNDAGHPSSIDPVTPEIIHASLLIFPELAQMTNSLNAWIISSYS